MAGFKFERNLPHQENAVKRLLRAFSGAISVADSDRSMANISNPLIEINSLDMWRNIEKMYDEFDIPTYDRHTESSNILDISMETGTGKTYTYTKMMFEFQKNLGVSKFIVVVPTLSIKAGTVNFLKGKSTKEHFRQEYGCELKTYVVESKKGNKKKKEYMPQAVMQFVEANSFGAKSIHVLVINAGMVNSETMGRAFDVNLFDRYSRPFEAIASVKPLMIIDEPHKFPLKDSRGKTATTWKNIEKFQAQYIIRYGATFKNEFQNLVYKLSAVDAFNGNLVKGVYAHIEKFDEGADVSVTLKSSKASEAYFELNINGTKTTHKLIKKESLSTIHKAMHGLTIESMNSKKVLLSNGLELTKNSTINPYSYDISLQDRMIESAIKRHFELERKLLTREVKIKPLTLFFIDDIEGYRDGNKLAGSLKTKFETIAKGHIERLLKSEKDGFYRDYLERSLRDLSLIHGGYFSKDNSEKDEKIAKEINEILHDKESLLSLDNVRRFIFSKWTLREGWDNPNVFQICKLRSSGSVTSKLQEVGRGLRLPVNEYMSRVKDEEFFLHYSVDFSEKDFVASLVSEINEKSGTLNEMEIPDRLSDEIIKTIRDIYPISEDELLETLDEAGSIKRTNEFKEGGYEILKTIYPDAFGHGLQQGKVRSDDEVKSKTTIRAGQYAELKELWESINQKVVLEYKVENEEHFSTLLENYFLDNISRFKPQGVATKHTRVAIEDGVAFYQELESVEDEILPVVTMSYRAFLLELSTVLSVNMQTLHSVFLKIQNRLDINLYRNMQTIRSVRVGFNQYLLDNAISSYKIGYSKISNSIHPTKLTHSSGEPKESINASDVGVHYEDSRVNDAYLFDELFFDSPLERENIVANIEQVTVFTKIPKNSIRIPVAGGGTYSPDFAYVLKDANGAKRLNLVIETKDVKAERDLRVEERQKIKHAEALFASFGGDVKVEFKRQLKGESMVGILREVLGRGL
ncbi:Type III restriction-modification system restriction subunit [hydrothermal vent metagenome]|uniref:Type III restriction-modification system restriction subunit n=1 Tax=hydrothermal vent metagenome TaxID=652676 RepID=A0A1W1BWD2_9ZZZZ